MRHRVSRLNIGHVTTRILASVAVASLLAGCSGAIERFTAGYANPSDADPVYTASVPKSKIKRPAATREDDSIVSGPLSAPRKTQVASLSDRTEQTTKRRSSLLSMRDEPVQENDSVDVAQAEPEMDQAPQQRRPAKTIRSASSKNGKIKVQEGMTLYGIASANNVPMKRLARANGLRSPYRIQVGQVLSIPGKSNVSTRQAVARSNKRGYAPAVESSSTVTETANIAAAQEVPSNGMHAVKSGDTIFSISRIYGVSPTVIADANNLTMKSKLSVGQDLKIPGAARKAQDQVAVLSPDTDAGTSESSGAIADGPKVTDVEDIPTVNTTKPEIDNGASSDAGNVEFGSAPGLRWPVKGKVISEFGSKPNGSKNEGVNIAVPEGTPIRAAENGVVAYAGSELKGYGNLILIRHEGGYVTAYAHAKEMAVKRGDIIKRGDIVGKAGKTGAVTSPQLHFEVRKGATALDPMKYLGSAQASN